MTIQRQYSLPNCRLVLEGWEDTTGEAIGGRPLLSMITNMECHFSGQDKPLTGGQELLDNLVYTVSCYIQGVLSGIERPVPPPTKSAARVQLQTIGEDLHRLTVNQAASQSDPSKYQVDLKTIQLFDLVEVMDQLVADVQTLPQLAVDLSPLPKRYVETQEPVTEKLIPATIGISSLAAAAIALFLIPVPEVMPPEVKPRSVTEEQVPGSQSSGEVPSIVLDDQPNNDSLLENNDIENDNTESEGQDNERSSDADGDEQSNKRRNEQSNEQTNNSLSRNFTGTPSTTSSTAGSTGISSGTDEVSNTTSPARVFPPTRDAVSSNPIDDQVDDDPIDITRTSTSQDDIDRILGSAQPISDPEQLNDLTLSLRDRVDRNWKRPEFMDDDLVYRVGLSDSGVLIGFKAINDAAKDGVDTVPLRQLDSIPLSPEASTKTSVGQFRVVFRTTGVVEVSPWYGRLSE